MSGLRAPFPCAPLFPLRLFGKRAGVCRKKVDLRKNTLGDMNYGLDR